MKKDILSHGTAIIEVGRCEQPTDDHECPEAVNSQGTACKRCDVSSCYRQGWGKLAVDADNTRRCITKGKSHARQ